jgi:hypothetical protein
MFLDYNELKYHDKLGFWHNFFKEPFFKNYLKSLNINRHFFFKNIEVLYEKKSFDDINDILSSLLRESVQSKYMSLTNKDINNFYWRKSIYKIDDSFYKAYINIKKPV